MRVITTKVHAALDYLIGALLIAAPWLFDFSRDGAETWVPVVLGIGVLLYSLLTRYEYSVFKSIPMKRHLTLDIVSGIFLAASPWMLGFSDYVYLPHLVLGAIEISTSLLTERQPRSGINENPPFERVAGTNLP